MPNFKNRSTLKEFLDDDNIPYRDIEQNMAELNIINLLLGGHAISIIGVNTLLQKETKTSFTICEIGCGGGDNLFAIATYLKRKRSIFN